MKKTFVFMIAVFAVALAFTSCEKEGQYTPKQKITEVKHTRTYKTPAGTEISRTEREVWTWNDKVLSYIDYYDANDNRSTALFRYDDNNRVIEINYGSTTAKFNYDNNLIKNIEIFSAAGTTIGKYELEHKGKTVTGMNVTLNDGKSVNSLPFNPLRLFIPENAADQVMENSPVKGTTHVLLTWTGKNVTAMEMNGENNMSYKWTYDDKNNPYKGLFDVVALGTDEIFSANNVVREEIMQGNNASATNYSYVYNSKKSPVKMTWESTMNFENILELPVTCVDEFQY